jgi:hypothetical protein
MPKKFDLILSKQKIMSSLSLLSIQSENYLHQSITNIDFLTPQDCLEVRSVLHDLRKLWIQQHPYFPFYTLGIASYLHKLSENTIAQYNTQIQRYNTLLWHNLGWLYERLAYTLTQKLAAPIHYPERLSLPGFHIFLSHKAFEQPIASIHCDLQYKQHKWEPKEAADFSNPISFTLAITLPKSGAGMNIWDLPHNEVAQLPQPKIERLTESRKKYFHAYELGKFSLHSGHFIHQIAPITNIQPDDERITLQGHGLLLQGVWHLYW